VFISPDARVSVAWSVEQASSRRQLDCNRPYVYRGTLQVHQGISCGLSFVTMTLVKTGSGNL